MLNSLWRSVSPSSRHVLVLSSILTVTSSGSTSSRAFISDFGHCQTRKFGTMATQSDLKKKMSEWAFASNQTLLSLPMDEEKRNFVRRENSGVIFSEVYPTPFQNKPM